MMQSFDLEMLFYAFLTSHFFFLNEMQMFRIIFFSGRIRVNTPRMLSKWEYKKTSKDSKRKIGLSVIFTKKRRVM